MSSSTNSIVAAFDLLTAEQQRALVEELTRRSNDRLGSEKQAGAMDLDRTADRTSVGFLCSLTVPANLRATEVVRLVLQHISPTRPEQFPAMIPMEFSFTRYLRYFLLTLFVLFAVTFESSRLGFAQFEQLGGLDGEWIFVEDRTEGRTLEQLGPPMSSKFSFRVENDTIFLNGHGSGHKDVRVTIHGAITEIAEPQTISRYRGSFKDGIFEYEVAFERLSGNTSGGIGMIRRRFKITNEGLMVSVIIDPPTGKESVALYRHAEDIAMPTPAKSVIGDLGWLAGAWTGSRSTGSSIEERWSPPLGGAMLAISRTVNTGGKMVAFEYLRIVERDSGLVYIAQPGGKTPTEFVLSEFSANRAVFENPRHDFPKRIVYELSANGDLSATIGQIKGGTPRRFEFKKQGN